MMPKKKNQESQAEQSERFKKAVRDLVDAGELNSIEADKALDGIVKRTPSRKS
jgi:polyhydroxyalkanoate synthesis regulator phasin